MLVLRFERLFAGKKCADPAGAKRLPQDAHIRGTEQKYRNGALLCGQQAESAEMDAKRKPVKNAVRTREKRVRSKRIKIIAKRC